MKYEEHGCIDINKLQEIENQKIEEKMQKKLKKESHHPTMYKNLSPQKI